MWAEGNQVLFKFVILAPAGSVEWIIFDNNNDDNLEIKFFGML